MCFPRKVLPRPSWPWHFAHFELNVAPTSPADDEAALARALLIASAKTKIRPSATNIETAIQHFVCFFIRKPSTRAKLSRWYIFITLIDLLCRVACNLRGAKLKATLRRDNLRSVVDNSEDKFREECGVFGIYGHAECARLTYL